MKAGTRDRSDRGPAGFSRPYSPHAHPSGLPIFQQMSLLRINKNIEHTPWSYHRETAWVEGEVLIPSRNPVVQQLSGAVQWERPPHCGRPPWRGADRESAAFAAQHDGGHLIRTEWCGGCRHVSVGSQPLSKNLLSDVGTATCQPGFISSLSSPCDSATSVRGGDHCQEIPQYPAGFPKLS